MKPFKRIGLASLVAFVAFSGVAQAGEYGHCKPWLYGLRDYFVPTKSGFYLIPVYSR
jgi:hypothetical protein